MFMVVYNSELYQLLFAASNSKRYDWLLDYALFLAHAIFWLIFLSLNLLLWVSPVFPSHKMHMLQ